MEKPPVNTVNEVELLKAEQSVEHFSLSEQEKNIQEVFKLSPELENIAVEATKSSEIVSLYRIENKNIEKEPDGITSHKDLKGQWFSPDLETALVYLRKSQQTFGTEAKRVEGANLVVVKIPREEFEKLHVSKHPIASQMDVENDNYIVPENIKRNYINLDNVQDKVGNFENLQKAKEQIKEKVRQFETKEAVELYQEYLKTIFPDSKVQDIVWHGTTSEEEFDDFDIDKESSFGFEKHGGVFFTSMIEDAKTRGSGKDTELAKKIIPVLMNVKNPLTTGQKEFPATVEDTLASGKEEIDVLLANKEIVKRWQEIGWVYRIENDELIVTKPIIKKQAGLMNSEGNLVVDLSQNAMFIGNISQWTTKPLASVGYDTIIDNNAASSGLNIEIGFNDQGRVLQQKSWFIALKAENIHILGSKTDIENFKEFVSKKENHNREVIEKYFQSYFLREDDDWKEVLFNNRGNEHIFQSILEERNKDIENIENFKNGQQLKLSIFNTYFKIVNNFVINKKREDGTYEGPQASRNWNVPKDTLYGDFTKELLLKHVNLRYDLLEEVLNSKIKPMLVGSTFNNSKGEPIKIKNVDFTSGEINFEHSKSKIDKRNYYEVIKTSVPLQEHITSLIKGLETKE